MSVHRGKQSEEVKNVFCYRRYAYANWDRQSENDEILTIYDATARFYPFRLFSYCIHFISLDSAQLIRSSIVRNDGFAREFGADRPVMISKSDLSDVCEACERCRQGRRSVIALLTSVHHYQSDASHRSRTHPRRQQLPEIVARKSLSYNKKIIVFNFYLYLITVVVNPGPLL